MNLIYFLAISLVLTGLATGGKYIPLNPQEKIIDSDYSINEIFFSKNIPQKIRKNLKLISIEYFSFDDKLHQGQILIHKELANDLIEIFKKIKEKKFPICKVIPINNYNWSDEESMKDNNTSAFNYRYIKGTKKLSSHALGRAIDINPIQNPQIKDRKTYPANTEYNIRVNGTITPNSFLVKEFLKRGWRWGGYWKRTKDYQHFEKIN